MLYSCTHVAPLDVKGLTKQQLTTINNKPSSDIEWTSSLDDSDPMEHATVLVTAQLDQISPQAAYTRPLELLETLCQSINRQHTMQRS